MKVKLTEIFKCLFEAEFPWHKFPTDKGLGIVTGKPDSVYSPLPLSNP